MPHHISWLRCRLNDKPSRSVVIMHHAEKEPQKDHIFLASVFPCVFSIGYRYFW